MYTGEKRLGYKQHKDGETACPNLIVQIQNNSQQNLLLELLQSVGYQKSNSMLMVLPDIFRISSLNSDDTGRLKQHPARFVFLLARDFDKGSLMCVLGNFLLMLLLHSFVIALCFYCCYEIFISIEAKHTSYIIFFHLKHFQSETDHKPKEEKSRKKHKVKHVGISNSLLLYFGHRSVVTCIPT